MPLNFEAPYEHVIEGDIFEIDDPTRSINVSIVLETAETLIFPGFRIRLYFEPITINTVSGYDFHINTQATMSIPRAWDIY